MTYDYGGAVDELAAATTFRRRPVAVELVVAVRNDEQRVGPWLRQVRKELRGWSQPAAIVVVDRGSVDYTVDVVAAVSDDGVPVYLINSSEPGARGWLGLAASSSSATTLALATMASDPTSVSAVLAVLDQQADVIAVTRGRRSTGPPPLAMHMPWRPAAPVPWEGLADVDFVCVERDAAQRLVRSAGGANDLADIVRLALAQGLTVSELRRYIPRGHLLTVHEGGRGADTGAAEIASA